MKSIIIIGPIDFKNSVIIINGNTFFQKYNAESYQINSEKNLIKEENDVDYYEKYIDLDDTSENFDYNFDKSNISGSEDIKEETRDVIANDREKKINRINSTFTKRNSKVENPEEKGNKNLQKLYKCKSCRANFSEFKLALDL